MTERERKLARHALGLPNAMNRSYRNRFYTAPVADNHADWMNMVGRGDAEQEPGKDRYHCDFFCLTEQGARKVLEAGELLDKEDFPTTPQPLAAKGEELCATSRSQ